jgi:hypothetical protein
MSAATWTCSFGPSHPLYPAIAQCKLKLGLVRDDSGVETISTMPIPLTSLACIEM